MRARRQVWSRTGRPCSGDQGFESAFLQQRVTYEPENEINSADSAATVFSPENAAIATRALNSALCCFRLQRVDAALLNPLGDYGQWAIVPAPTFEPVFADQHGVDVPRATDAPTWSGSSARSWNRSMERLSRTPRTGSGGGAPAPVSPCATVPSWCTPGKREIGRYRGEWGQEREQRDGKLGILRPIEHFSLRRRAQSGGALNAPPIRACAFEMMGLPTQSAVELSRSRDRRRAAALRVTRE
jgi:hypothetical protein